MASQRITVHEAKLANNLAYLRRKESELRTLAAEVSTLQQQCARLQMQIARAKRLGKESFDAERLYP